MMRAWLLAGFLAAGLSAPAAGQQYRFKVPEVRCDVLIEKDGSLRIRYQFTFENMHGARPIDIVDVGMPIKGYKVVRASIDGKGLTSWTPSSNIEIGPVVPLGGSAIQPGKKGVFRIEATVPPGLVWDDTTNPGYASFRFTPTWFGKRYVVDRTKLVLAYIFPKGVDPADVKWQKKTDRYDLKGLRKDVGNRPVVAWIRNVSFTEPHMFGVSFPKRGMTNVQAMTNWKLFVFWWTKQKELQFVSGLGFYVLFGWVFFKLTAGTGWSVFLVLLGVGAYFLYTRPVLHVHFWLFVPFWLGLWRLSLWRRRKMKYFPAELCVEGGRIKRGLSAVEAAVLLEVPLGRVLNMVVFGMLSRGILRIIEDDPLTVRLDGARESPIIVRRADGRRMKLHPYEVQFLDVIRGRPLADLKFDGAIKSLVNMVKYKMTGFDLEKTREYYRSIVDRAWKQAKGAVDIQRDAYLDRYFGWLYMDGDFGDRWGGLETGGYYYRPVWLGYSHSGGGGTAGASAAPSGGGGAPDVRFSDVSHSFIGRTESVAGCLAGSADSFLSTASADASLLDLSSIDTFTSDTLSAMAEGGGGYGGGCACAGCACACACAGGGA